MHIELISLAELWRINALGQKYCSLLEQENALSAAYTCLKVVDEYFEQTIMPKIDPVEMVADVMEWLSMKYKTNKQDAFDLQFHDDKDVADRKCKAPSCVSAYEITKKVFANVSGVIILGMSFWLFPVRASASNHLKWHRTLLTTKNSTHSHMWSSSSTPIPLYLRHLMGCFVMHRWFLQLNSERIHSWNKQCKIYSKLKLRYLSTQPNVVSTRSMSTIHNLTSSNSCTTNPSVWRCWIIMLSSFISLLRSQSYWSMYQYISPMRPSVGLNTSWTMHHHKAFSQNRVDPRWGRSTEGDPHTPEWPPPETRNEQAFNILAIYLRDEVARIYQQSSVLLKSSVHIHQSLDIL